MRLQRINYQIFAFTQYVLGIRRKKKFQWKISPMYLIKILFTKWLMRIVLQKVSSRVSTVKWLWHFLTEVGARTFILGRNPRICSQNSSSSHHRCAQFHGYIAYKLLEFKKFISASVYCKMRYKCIIKLYVQKCNTLYFFIKLWLFFFSILKKKLVSRKVVATGQGSIYKSSQLSVVK